MTFHFWLRTREGDIMFDTRVGTWHNARAFAEGVRDNTGETVFFYDTNQPNHRSFAPWWAKQGDNNE